MSVDKFGRSISGSSSSTSGGLNNSHLFSPYQHDFIFTSDGNIDVENLKLCNVKSPTESSDCANKQYVDTNNENLLKKITSVKDTIPIIVAQHSDLERKAFLSNVKDLETQINSAIRVLPDMINQKVDLDTKAYKRGYDDEIKKLQQKIHGFIRDMPNIISQQIDLETRPYKAMHDDELKKVRSAIVYNTDMVRTSIARNNSELKGGMNQLKYDLENLITAKMTEQKSEIIKDLADLENKLKDFQKTVQNRFGALVDLIEK